jgi:hypothetical protein
VFFYSPSDHSYACSYRIAGIKAVWERRNEFQITESVQYYFNRIDNIKLPGYVPDKDDILYSRSRTSGIVTERYNIDGTIFEMYDVGGQRNERRKWIHCFEGEWLDLIHTLSICLPVSELTTSTRAQ